MVASTAAFRHVLGVDRQNHLGCRGPGDPASYGYRDFNELESSAEKKVEALAKGFSDAGACGHADMMNYAAYSFWLETAGEELIPRPALQHSAEVDVAILGAGYSGLWTAYYLLRDNPGLSVAIVEKQIAGFGAS